MKLFFPSVDYYNTKINSNYSGGITDKSLFFSFLSHYSIKE